MGDDDGEGERSDGCVGLGLKEGVVAPSSMKMVTIPFYGGDEMI